MNPDPSNSSARASVRTRIASALVVGLLGLTAGAGGASATERTPASATQPSATSAPEDRVVLVGTGGITWDDVSAEATPNLWAAAEEEFGQELLADILVAIATINVWNRIAVPTHLQAPPLA